MLSERRQIFICAGLGGTLMLSHDCSSIKHSLQFPSSPSLPCVSTPCSPAGGKAAVSTEPDAVLQLPSDGHLQFADVAVGGTFDRLHAGHRLLLAVAALVSTRMVYIGVTSEPVWLHKLLQQRMCDPAFEAVDAHCAGWLWLLNLLHELKTSVCR